MSQKNENIFKKKGGCSEVRYIKARMSKNYIFEKSYSIEQVQSKNSDFEKMALQWLEELKPIRKKSTIVKYMSQLKNYIIPAFGKFNLSDISNENIISFSNKLLTNGRNGKKLSPKTVLDIISRMKSIRRFALLRGYEVNYVPNAVEISLEHGQIKTLNQAEENKLLRYLKNHFDLTALGILFRFSQVLE